VQTVTTTRLEQIRARLADLTLHEILDALLERCLATRHTHPCPIAEALMGHPRAH
jgi:hypothetical protein